MRLRRRGRGGCIEVRESGQQGSGGLLIKCTPLSKLRREADSLPDLSWGSPVLGRPG